jgi:exopolysaccharide biosynthesis WecB/TagA/CpsF family protein
MFPSRFPIAGVMISSTDYAEATAAILMAAGAGRSALVAATSAHGVVTAATDSHFGQVLNSFDLLTPDGQPIRWGLNLLYHRQLVDRVYGPTLLLHVCQAAAHAGVGVYFYGARQEVLASLVQRLMDRVPGLFVAGFRSPPFRPLTREEDTEDIRAIKRSGAGIVFVGLGCPRQERWAYEHRDRLRMPLVCVGAAFDFHAGVLRQAPSWMQARGLEWLFRLIMEPRRLWRRYARSVPLYAALVARQYMLSRLSPEANTLGTQEPIHDTTPVPVVDVPPRPIGESASGCLTKSRSRGERVGQ